MRYAAFAVMTLLLTRCQPEQPKPQTVNLVYDSTYQRLIPHVKRGDKISFNQLPQGASIAWNSDTSPCMMLDDHTCQIRNDASKIYTFKCAPDTNVRCDPQVAVDEDRQENKPNLAVLPPPKDGSRVPVNVVVEISCKNDTIVVAQIDPVNLNAPNQALVWNAPRQDVSRWSVVFVPQQGSTPESEQMKICTTTDPISDQDTHRGCNVPQPAMQAKYYVKAGDPAAGAMCKMSSAPTSIDVQ